MLSALLLGSLALVINMFIQVVAVVLIVGFLLRRINADRISPGFRTDIKIMCVVLLLLFSGHVLQFASWAILFVWLGEFSDFETAFYHSVVNFTSLGYGDIVMSEKWRLLGALEAANGILMFGLSSGGFLAVMLGLFNRHKIVADAREKRSHT
jgi:hypothetical protein